MLQLARPKLEKDIHDILQKSLKEAFMTTFFDAGADANVTAFSKKEIEKGADKFAKAGADAGAYDLSVAIYNFVKEIGIIATPTTLASPTGPVTGVIKPTEIKIL